MGYPKLVHNPKTPIRVVIKASEANEFNERDIVLDKSFLCNYQDASELKYSADKQTPEITGTAYINGDILPNQSIINSGYVVIFGDRREIKRGTKGRNLDGSVNFTKLEVI